MATFYIEAVEATDIKLSKVGSPTVGTARYGINNSSVPNTYTYGGTISLSAGDKCYWTITSTSTAFSTSNYLRFTSTAKINVGGNLSDLIGGNTKIPRIYCFYRLFYSCTNLLSASNLIAVDNFNLKTNCYRDMFRGCTSLTTAPALPATALTSYCYNNMFCDCKSLTAAPELPATTLAKYCYHSMFWGCTNIRLSETQTAQYSIPYRIPSEGTGTVETGSLTEMFTNTGGTFTGTPTINTTYYLEAQSSPISIAYKGQELVNFETGSKTLKCGDKYMEGDVVITREIGGNDVAVLYNSATILTFQNGTKTLKCAGKCMATDLVVQIS